MNGFDLAFFATLLSAGIRMSVPLIFGAVGNVATEKSGVMNIGLEGQMLIGAFFSFFVCNLTGSLTNDKHPVAECFRNKTPGYGFDLH